MPNARLRDALLRHGLDLDQVARATHVDPKTVERWISKGRLPYPKHRRTIAAMVRETENYLWPDAITPERKTEIGGSEIVQVYPHRRSVPTELWTRLLNQTKEHVEILVYSGMFLTDDPTLIKRLHKKAEDGTKIRLLLGDPASPGITRRSLEEGVGKGTMAAKARNALAFYRQLGTSQESRFAATAPPCTTASTASTRRCSSTPMCTVLWRHTLRFCTCVGSPAATCSRPTRRASRTSGTPPCRPSDRTRHGKPY